MSIQNKVRLEVERRIAQQAIADLLEAGYTLGVNDGEEITIKESTDAEAVLKAMATTDEDYLLAYRDGKRVGWVRFIYGNDGWDVINDYTTNLEEALTKTTALTDKFSDESQVEEIIRDVIERASSPACKHCGGSNDVQATISGPQCASCRALGEVVKAALKQQ